MKDTNLIRKIAWSFHQTSGLEWDDLFQEAAYAYLLALKEYDPAKGKLSTHMWWAISNHLKNYLKYQRKWYDFVYAIDEEAYDSAPVWEKVGEAGWKVIELILQMPDQCSTKQEIETQMRHNGEEYRTIWIGIKQCKEAFQ